MSRPYLRFWGVRGSYAAPHRSHLGVGGNTSCVEIRAGDHLLVCDGGTGIIPLGESLQAGCLREMLVVFTHYHWDHICGLPFFPPAFQADWTIRFFGPGESADAVERQLSNQMKAPYFPVETEIWLANIEYLAPRDGGFSYGPMQIRHHQAHHPGVTYGYRVTIDGRSVVYMSDNEVCFLKSSLARRVEEFDAEERALHARIEHEERQREVAAVRGAEILIHDAQYAPADYARKRGWGHSCYVDAVNFAIDAQVKALYLFHHDPTYDDARIEEIHRDCKRLVAARGATLDCAVAREGLVVEF